MSLARLNTPEKILLGYFAYLSAASFFVPLDSRQRLVAVTTNCLIAGVLLLVSQRASDRRWLAALRPWLPSFFILVAYRESGLLLTPDPTHHLDYIFIRLDDALLKSPTVFWALDRGAPWIQYYLEFAYLLCYPVVPLGLLSLYLIRSESRATAWWAPRPDVKQAMEHFWTAVLLASLTCYFLFPFFPLVPPRELFNDVPGPRVAPLLRSINQWLLVKYSVGASLFPSAHVAATIAMALAIRHYLARLGLGFVVVALSITLATVYGRYHYALDAVTGAFLGFAAYGLSCRWIQRK